MARCGDEESFRTIYFALRDPIYSFVFRMLNNEAAAEDITHEVFLFFIQNSAKFEAGRSSLFTFLCGVARNKVFKQFKANGRHPATNGNEIDESLEKYFTTFETPLWIYLRSELAEKIYECLNKLSPLQREVIVLRYVNECSYKEIAEITMADISLVKARLFRAHRNLEKQLGEYTRPSEQKNYEMR